MTRSRSPSGFKRSLFEAGRGFDVSYRIRRSRSASRLSRIFKGRLRRSSCLPFPITSRRYGLPILNDSARTTKVRHLRKIISGEDICADVLRPGSAAMSHVADPADWTRRGSNGQGVDIGAQYCDSAALCLAPLMSSAQARGHLDIIVDMRAPASTPPTSQSRDADSTRISRTCESRRLARRE